MFKKYLSALLVLVFVLSAGALSVLADEDDTEIIPMYGQGDVNLDTKVNIKDVTLVQKYLAKITELTGFQLLLADVDGKEGISIKDATHLQKWLAGLVDVLHNPLDHTEPTTASSDASEGVTSQTASSVVGEITATEATEPTSTAIITDPTEATEPTSTAVITDSTEATEPTSTAIITDPTEATEPTSTAIITDPTEATKPTSTTVATEPAETTGPTEATQPTTRDPNKPIELPFVPAK